MSRFLASVRRSSSAGFARLRDLIVPCSGVRWAWLLLFVWGSGWAATTYYNLDGYENMVIPREYGRLQTIATGHDKRYPSRDHFAQLMIFIDTTSGGFTRLIRTIDTNPRQSTRWRVWTPSSGAVLPCVDTQPCLMIDQPEYDADIEDTIYNGQDWRKAAQIYKNWVVTQSWYRSHGKLRWPNHLSHTLTCSTNSYSFFNTNLRPLISHLRERAGCFITQYRTSSFDTNYPDYTCSVGANCPALLQALKDDNAIAFPYINGSLVDVYSDAGDSVPNSNYNVSETCINSSGNPTQYASTSMRYVDPLLATWPSTLYTAWSNLKATDGSNSTGVYLDVLGATQPPVCYYGGVPNYGAWIAGMKEVYREFDEAVVMTELPGEIYLPFADVVYNYLGTNDSYRVPLYGFLYGDIPGLYIIGWTVSGTDTDADIVADWDEAVNQFYLDDILFQSLTAETNLLTAGYENALRKIARKDSNTIISLNPRGRNFPNQTGNDGSLSGWIIKSDVYGVRIEPSATVAIKNSVIDCSSGGYCLDVGVGANYTGQNNHFVIGSNSTPFRFDATNYATLAEWQAATGQETNSGTGDPLFVGGTSPSTAEGFRPSTNSPLCGAGAYTDAKYDYNHERMPLPRDIGALNCRSSEARTRSSAGTRTARTIN